MGIYEGFAAVYDRFMEETPYEKWRGQLTALLSRYGVRGGICCELGCGTGTMTRLLAEAGFDMIGIDASDEMLSVAREYETERIGGIDGQAGDMADEDMTLAETGGAASRSILYLCQDMREMELFGTVAAFVAVCDTMNYLEDEQDWADVLSLADNYLDPGGLFVFDLRTEAYYRDLGEGTLTDSAPEGSYIWENHVDAENQTNYYSLELYVREDIACGGSKDRYVRSTEEHETHWISVEELKGRIEKSGLKLLEIADGETLEAPNEESRRLYVICRECTKQPVKTAL